MSRITRQQLQQWCHRELSVSQFKDYAPNGLQVEGKADIGLLVTGVTACEALIDAAIDAGADGILVHHGYFWKGEAPELTGMKGRRIRKLMQHELNLFAYHLPLDAHGEWGNNRALADRMNWRVSGPLIAGQQPAIGNIADLEQPIEALALELQLTEQLSHPVQWIAGGPTHIRRIGWCTGAAQDYLEHAVAQGCDAFVSGEISERTVHEAREMGIHYFAAGHHATEKGGVQRLGQAIAAEFGIQVEFIDIPNPV